MLSTLPPVIWYPSFIDWFILIVISIRHRNIHFQLHITFLKVHRIRKSQTYKNPSILMRSYKSTDKMCRSFPCQILRYPISVWYLVLGTQLHSCFYPPKSEYLYTVYFIRGVDNTLTEFDAKAVIDTCRCRLDIYAWLGILLNLWNKWHVICP